MKAVCWFILAITLFSTEKAMSQGSPSSKIKLQFVNGYWLVDFKSDNISGMRALKLDDAGFDPAAIGTEGVEQLYRKYLKNNFWLQVDDTSMINVKFVSAEINSAKANAQFISARYENCGSKVKVGSTAYSKLDGTPVKLVLKVGEEKHVSWLTEDNHYEYEVNLDSKMD